MSINSNRLSSEKSPYLLQHKNNPVNWYAWGQDAFRAAREENKPIFLSIGYSTCYWCHVMEKDSFEMQEVADVLNRYFISIKVDREERPDVDQIYMDAVIGLSGHGGWPMSVFLTPELKPFWGGTFFYREQFIGILQRINELWSADKNQLLQSSQQITDYLKDRVLQGDKTEIRPDFLKSVTADFEKSFDDIDGGFGKAPKFPPSMQIGLLLRLNAMYADVEALKMSLFTLDKMGRGGIYDQIGGGFHRYSVDEKWLVPHFEKMLYDNALLSFTYLEAYQTARDERLAEIARGTLDYVLRDMANPDGAFYSAEDAGEVGKEGEFYVWTRAELSDLLSPDELKIVERNFGLSEDGNFEHNTNIFTFKAKDLSADEYESLNAVKKKILELRSKRERPHLDDKIITGWNGLMISAFAKGYQVLSDRRYLEAAQNAAAFIRNKLWQNGKLKRHFRDGCSEANGFLEDYAYLIEGLIHLYESDFNLEWIKFARELQAVQDELFWDKPESGYFFSDSPDLIIRKKEFIDSAMPSANSTSLSNLIRLNGFFADSDLHKKSQDLISLQSALFEKYPSAFPKALHGVAMITSGMKEFVIAEGKNKEDADRMLKFIYAKFIPAKCIAVSTDEMQAKSPELPLLLQGRKTLDGMTAFYVCENTSCQAPTKVLEEAKSIFLG